MPILDHFHPPLSQRRHWESFHSAWVSTLADTLNRDCLPAGYFAEELITVGGRVEIDVATMEEGMPAAPTPLPEGDGRNGGTAVALAKRTWTPPQPTMTMPAVFPDSFSVQIYRSEGGMTLVAAIELVSPANKDRDTHRQAFGVKCANYLYQGVGLVVVDIVTSRHSNLHNEIVRLLSQPAPYQMGADVFLYSVAYRPVRRENRPEIDVWQQPLALGQELPTMPLALSGTEVVPVDLEATYQDVCQRRVPV